MLEALISSKTRLKLLTLFLLNPGSEFYIREIAGQPVRISMQYTGNSVTLNPLAFLSGKRKETSSITR